MIPEVHLSVRIAILQVSAVMVGVFMTRAAFMMAGYPESNLDWNRLALLVRDYGFALLPIPAAWAVTVIYLEKSSLGWWSHRWTLITGISILAALALLFVWSYSNPHHFHKMPFRTMREAHAMESIANQLIKSIGHEHENFHPKVGIHQRRNRDQDSS